MVFTSLGLQVGLQESRSLFSEWPRSAKKVPAARPTTPMPPKTYTAAGTGRKKALDAFLSSKLVEIFRYFSPSRMTAVTSLEDDLSALGSKRNLWVPGSTSTDLPSRWSTSFLSSRYTVIWENSSPVGPRTSKITVGMLASISVTQV